MSENTIGQRLTWARETAGLSLSQAARLMFTERQLIVDMEEGRTDPGFSVLNLFSLLYDADLCWLQTGIERQIDMGNIPAQVSKEDAESLRRVFARGRQNS